MEFDTATGDVLIGVEFEVQCLPPGDKRYEEGSVYERKYANNIVKMWPELFDRVEGCRPTNAYSRPTPGQDDSNPYGYYAHICDDKWGIKNEGPMGTEWNFTHPLPFREYLPMMEGLFTWFAKIQDAGFKVSTNADMGMHVHINVKPDKGACVPQDSFIQAYFADGKRHQAKWYDLEEHKTRKRRGNCTPVSNAMRVPKGQSKCTDIAPTQFGSVELRHWDTTMDWDLIEARGDALGELIRDGLAVTA